MNEPVFTGSFNFMKPQKILIQPMGCPEDSVIFTTVIRDLKENFKDQYLINVDPLLFEIWSGNPYLSPEVNKENADLIFTPTFSMINQSNNTFMHATRAIRIELGKLLGITIPEGPLCCDVHLNDKEKEITFLDNKIDDTRYWIIHNGFKVGVPVSRWYISRYQQVIDHFKDKLTFVQVGFNRFETIPELSNVVNLVGELSHRQLLALVYHSAGILTTPDCFVHLATMQGREDRIMKNRPCVVLSGGRIPPLLHFYTNHDYIHTCGKLPCCDNGGCWATDIKPVEGYKRTLCKFVCHKAEEAVPLCMDMISVERVIKSIEDYEKGFALYNALK